jgi:hypothetical protein
MSSDKELKNESIVPSKTKGLTKYSSGLIRRGLDLAKKLDRSDVAVEAETQRTEIPKPKAQTWKCVHNFTAHSDH